MAKEIMKVGEDAKNALTELLSESDINRWMCKYQKELSSIGGFGYFKDRDVDRYVAFDHRSGQCNVEDFKTKEEAIEWLNE